LVQRPPPSALPVRDRRRLDRQRSRCRGNMHADATATPGIVLARRLPWSTGAIRHEKGHSPPEQQEPLVPARPRLPRGTT
jgi:hypothetical protein